MITFTIFLAIALAISILLGAFGGAGISGTTIPGLKLAMVIYPAMISTLVGIIVGFFFGTAILVGGACFVAFSYWSSRNQHLPPNLNSIESKDLPDISKEILSSLYLLMFGGAAGSLAEVFLVAFFENYSLIYISRHRQRYNLDRRLPVQMSKLA